MAWISGDHDSGNLMTRMATFESSLLPPIRGTHSEGPSFSSSDCYESEEAVDVAAENRQSEKKRRLTAEQARLLESNFAVNKKLEPERKEKLAKELELQPRQVAVWFQNQRSRSKSKQLENDFQFLKSHYESVMLEREKLQAEVNRLTRELEERQEQEHEEEDVVADDEKMVREWGRLEEEGSIEVKGKEESAGCTNKTESMEMHHNIISEGFLCLQRPQQTAYAATYSSANKQSFFHGSVASSTSDISRLHQQQQHMPAITKSEDASPSHYQLPHNLGIFSLMDDNESSAWPWMH